MQLHMYMYIATCICTWGITACGTFFNDCVGIPALGDVSIFMLLLLGHGTLGCVIASVSMATVSTHPPGVACMRGTWLSADLCPGMKM